MQPIKRSVLFIVFSQWFAGFKCADSVRLERALVYFPNCLTKNLLEMDSLPQIKNLLEMSEISSAAKVSGGVRDEVNDERKKAYRGGQSRAIPAGAEERENRNFE